MNGSQVGALSHARYVSCILYMFGFDDKPGISKTAIIEKGHGKSDVHLIVFGSMNIYLVKTTQQINAPTEVVKFTHRNNQQKTAQNNQELEVVQPCVFPLDYPSFIYCGLAMFCQIKNLQ